MYRRKEMLEHVCKLREGRDRKYWGPDVSGLESRLHLADALKEICNSRRAASIRDFGTTDREKRRAAGADSPRGNANVTQISHHTR